MRLRWLPALFLRPNVSPTPGQVGLGSLMECQKCKTQWRRAIFKSDDFQIVGSIFEAILIEEGSSRSGAHFSLLADHAREFATLVTPDGSCQLLLGKFVVLPSGINSMPTPKGEVAYTIHDVEEGLPTLTSKPLLLALSGEVRKDQHRSVKKVDECKACLFRRAVEQGVPLVSGDIIAHIVEDNKPWVSPDEPGVVKSDIGALQTMRVHDLDLRWAECSIYMMGREAQGAYLDAPYGVLTVLIKPYGFFEIYHERVLRFKVENQENEQMILNILLEV